MFKSKKSKQPSVSPLHPPPASTAPYPQYQQQDFYGRRSPGSSQFNPQQQQSEQQRQQYFGGSQSTDKRDRRQSLPMGGVPNPMYADREGGGANEFGAPYARNGARPLSMGPGQSLSVPSPIDLHRVSTAGTVGTTGTAGSGTDKKEKRRSGFFGFGKKDKDKDKEKEPRDRPSSFTVGRPSSSSDNQAFSRHTMAGTPHQLSNSTHANDDRFNGFESNELRRVSAPIPNEFGPGDSRYAKSQSMAFGSGRGIRDEPQMSQQIRQQSDETIRNMAKSQSMPFSRLNERSNSGDSIPSRDKRSSPMDTQGPNRGYGGLPDKVTPPPPVDKTPKQSPRLASAGQIGNSSPSQNNSYKLHSFDNIVELIAAQPQKTYVASPPELEMILARTSAGGQPKQGQPGSATNDWDSVWLQLSGISLSMWSMKETRAAAAKGEKVPPTYFNITDSSLELLAPLPPPPHRPNSHPHHFVFSLNTAGSNRLLFSCPTEKDVAKWATGLRLAAWERARLEEIYTGHLIKSEGMDTAPSQLVRGRMEGWVRVRVMGGTDWKRLWVVLSTPDVGKDDLQEKKNRRRSLFGIGDSKDKDPVQEPNTGERMASFYLEQRTQRNQTSNTPVLTITNVSQAYAVFPERLEVMSQSNLMKVVGRINGDLVTIEGRLRDSGWALIMPEAPDAVSGSPSQSSASPLSDMMRWVTGFHDVFELYGRPGNYSWDVKDPKSLFFAYPQGERRGRLFLDIDEAMRSDFRTSNLPAIRGAFRSLVERRLLGPHAEYRSEGDLGGQVPQPHNNSYRLPPLAFDKSGAPNGQPGEPRSLTPITERTDIASRNPSTKTEKSTFFTSDGSGGGQHRQVSKQTSGGSSRNTGSVGGDERLATIADSNENPGQVMDTVPVQSPVEQIPRNELLAETPGTNRTHSTNWSQSSGAAPEDSEDHTPQPGGSFNIPISKEEQKLPDLPAGNASTPESSTTARPASGATSPDLAPALPPISTSQTRDTPVLSPKPRRGSVEKPTSVTSTASGYDQAAAAYLANVVEKRGGQQPLAAQQFIRSPEAGHTPLDLNRVSEDRTRPTIITQFDSSTNERRPSSGPDLGRKPSGARPLPTKSDTVSSSRLLQPTAEEYQDNVPEHLRNLPRKQRLSSSGSMADLGEDAADFVAFADQPSPAKAPSALPTRPAASAASAIDPKPQEEEYRSSFAPSRAAAERKAKAEQAAADQQMAKNVPGGGKRVRGVQGGTWSDASEDEEEEDEESEEEGHAGDTKGKSTGPPTLPPLSHQTTGDGRQIEEDAPVQRVVSQTRALPAIPRPNGDAGSMSGVRENDSGRLRAVSTPDRFGSRSRSPPAPLPQPPVIYATKQQTPLPQPPPPPAARQTIWNANFSADHGLDQQTKSGKFVDIDEPAQLTKAFAPHGLLQAGMQDKEDRSAKKQEELARELGSSLVHVPEKPPPPQTGLLGAVAQHEKERQNAGGIGATITDRERERRLAEDRQREIERLQRQQMDHMRQYGGEGGGNMSMYGGSQQYPPYMGMMGMPPPMGYNPYQSAYNPQQGYNPYAQQQAMMAAQMAYQQAMMAYGPPAGGGGAAGAGSGFQSHHPQSMAGGSQAGDHDRPSSPASQTGHQSMSGSPGTGVYPPFFHHQGYGWPGMSPPPQMNMGWASPSPPPPHPGSMPWMGSQPGFGGQGSYQGMHGQVDTPGSHISEERPRVQSMMSDGQGSTQAMHPN